MIDSTGTYTGVEIARGKTKAKRIARVVRRTVPLIARVLNINIVSEVGIEFEVLLSRPI